MFYKYICVCFVSLSLLISVSYAYSEKDIISSIDDSDNEYSFAQIYSKIKNNDIAFDYKNIIRMCKDIFFSEVKSIIGILKYMLIIVFINAFLTNLNLSFVSKGTNNAVYLASCCFFIVLTSGVFSQAGQICISFLTRVISLLKVSIPVCISLIASCAKS